MALSEDTRTSVKDDPQFDAIFAEIQALIVMIQALSAQVKGLHETVRTVYFHTIGEKS